MFLDCNGYFLNLGLLDGVDLHYSDMGEPYAVYVRFATETEAFECAEALDFFVAKQPYTETLAERFCGVHDMSRIAECWLHYGRYDLPEPNVVRLRFLGHDAYQELTGESRDQFTRWLQHEREAGTVLAVPERP